MMRESLIEVKVVKAEKGNAGAGFNLDCNYNKYISKTTASKIKLMVKKIFEELPEKIILFHQLANRPVFNISEEQTGVYLESPYIDYITMKPEYKKEFEAIINQIKRDYAMFCLGRKGKMTAGRAC